MVSIFVLDSKKIQYTNGNFNLFLANTDFHGFKDNLKIVDIITSYGMSFSQCDSIFMEIEIGYLRLCLYQSGPAVCALHSKPCGNTVVFLMLRWFTISNCLNFFDILFVVFTNDFI